MDYELKKTFFGEINASGTAHNAGRNGGTRRKG